MVASLLQPFHGPGLNFPHSEHHGLRDFDQCGTSFASFQKLPHWFVQKIVAEASPGEAVTGETDITFEKENKIEVKVPDKEKGVLLQSGQLEH